MYLKTNDTAILRGKTGWWEAVEIGSRRGIGYGEERAADSPVPPLS